MAKNKRNPRTTPQKPPRDRTPAKEQAPAGQGDTARNIRETVESIVIAFVLAFLFRTFEAEAFVIPTGSMAPTLRGQHKDVECPMCGYYYQASASVEAEDDSGGFFSVAPGDRPSAVAQTRLPPDLAAPRLGMRSRLRPRVITATCPMCRYTMPVDELPTYNGDRILVNKFIYEFADPRRWDVVVFKFPGDAKVNYIKRVVGLPNETVLIRNGNIWVRQAGDESFRIARKPPDKVRSMMQIVHDDRYQPKELLDQGWPRRWQSVASDAGGWNRTEVEGGEKNVHDVFSHDAGSDKTHWIRYHHFVPSWSDWQRMRAGRLSPSDVARIRPRLITDYYAYNTWMTLNEGEEPHASKLGLHWVGDLIVQCNVNVRQAKGSLHLDLVKAGQHFECRIDLETGGARLSIRGHDAFERSASGVMPGTGQYRVTFANVDDQLLLWVDGRLVPFDQETTYDVDQAFGSRQNIVPRSDPSDPGDLSPVGIGARDADVDVDALRVSRDVYYIADDFGGRNEPITDYDLQRFPIVSLARPTSLDFLSDPSQWDVFRERQQLQFSMAGGQYFVLGDNSPFSKDGRLWKQDHFGHYVERQLLIGKALFIYWPHSWNRIPGTGIPLPFFPNFQDMGLVR